MTTEKTVLPLGTRTYTATNGLIWADCAFTNMEAAKALAEENNELVKLFAGAPKWYIVATPYSGHEKSTLDKWPPESLG